MRNAVLVVIAFLVTACAVTPAPQWQLDLADALDGYTEHYLRGHSRVAERYLADARAAASATGRLDVAARTELIHCAVASAALDFAACASYAAVQADASAQDQAYADFLYGSLQSGEAGKLPEQYRKLAAVSDPAEQNQALKAIEDPVSRLIAAGALFRSERLSPAGVETAVDTASAHGFRRPLLAYLNVQARLAKAGGDEAVLETIRKRIELVSGTAEQRD